MLIYSRATVNSTVINLQNRNWIALTDSLIQTLRSWLESTYALHK